jgi:cyclohexanone monooxygenase
MREQGLETIEPELGAENEWVDHVQEVANKTLFPLANSWYMGANIPGKPRLFMPYIAGVGSYRRTCEEIVTNDYHGFHFEAVSTQSPESTMRPILASAVNRPLSY